MKPRRGWLLTRDGSQQGAPVATIATIVPSRKVTNKAVDDIVREHHLREVGRLWPNPTVWKSQGAQLVLKTPLCTYRLTLIEVYG